MRVKEYSLKITKDLKSAGIEFAKLEADLFLCECFAWERHQIVLYEEKEVKSSDIAIVDEWVLRRKKGEPFAYIVGYKHFYKHKFFVDNNVLIPRPETELMVEHALSWLDSLENINLIDIGCGSGCLGLSVLGELTSSKLILIDISKEALEMAKKNAGNLGLEKDCSFMCKDVNQWDFSALKNSFDIVLANPPYIDPLDGFVEDNVKAYEPELALFAEENGLKEIRNWIILSESIIKKNGLLLMEFGDGQANDVLKIINARHQYKEIQIHKDYAGLARFVSAIKI